MVGVAAAHAPSLAERLGHLAGDPALRAASRTPVRRTEAQRTWRRKEAAAEARRQVGKWPPRGWSSQSARPASVGLLADAADAARPATAAAAPAAGASGAAEQAAAAEQRNGGRPRTVTWGENSEAGAGAAAGSAIGAATFLTHTAERPGTSHSGGAPGASAGLTGCDGVLGEDFAYSDSDDDLRSDRSSSSGSDLTETSSLAGEKAAAEEAARREAEVADALNNLMETLTPRQYCVRQGRQSGGRGHAVAASRHYLGGLEHAPDDGTMIADFRRSVQLLRSTSRNYFNADRMGVRRGHTRQRYERLPTDRPIPPPPPPPPEPDPDDRAIDRARRAHFARTWSMVKHDTADLFKRETELSPDEVKHVIWTKWDAIKLAFRMYSSENLSLQLEGYNERVARIKRIKERQKKEPEDDHYLGVMEFFSFMINTGLVSNKRSVKLGHLTKAQVNLLFIRANWERDDDGNFIDDQSNPDNALMLHEFISVCMRAAKETMVLAPTMAGKIKLFLEEHMSRSLMADRSGLRKDLQDPAIQNCLRPYMCTLENIFVHYAGYEPGGGDKTIVAAEWRSFVNDLGLGFPRYMQGTNEIFVSAQADDDFDHSGVTDDALVPNSGADLIFSEFLEAICRLAVLFSYPGGVYPKKGDIDGLLEALQAFLDSKVIQLAPADDDEDSPNYERIKRLAEMRKLRKGWSSIKIEPKVRWMAAMSKTRKSIAVSSLLGLGKLSGLSKEDPDTSNAIMKLVAIAKQEGGGEGGGGEGGEGGGGEGGDGGGEGGGGEGGACGGGEGSGGGGGGGGGGEGGEADVEGGSGGGEEAQGGEAQGDPTGRNLRALEQIGHTAASSFTLQREAQQLLLSQVQKGISS